MIAMIITPIEVDRTWRFQELLVVLIRWPTGTDIAKTIPYIASSLSIFAPTKLHTQLNHFAQNQKVQQYKEIQRQSFKSQTNKYYG